MKNLFRLRIQFESKVTQIFCISNHFNKVFYTSGEKRVQIE